MLEIKKFIVGIRPFYRMFRVESIYGVLVDEILALRGVGLIIDEFYKEVLATQTTEKLNVIIRNKEFGNHLTISSSDVIFIKDYYDLDEKININKAIDEFQHIWKPISSILKIKDIRRIGLAIEQRSETENSNSSSLLLAKLTNIELKGFPEKFTLRYEDRSPTTGNARPDDKESDFTNIIYSFYDGTLDNEHPKKDTFNANIDYQRYYSPLFNDNVFKEIKNLKSLFDKEKEVFNIKLQEKGLA